MPKIPTARPDGWRCNPRLPIEALGYRKNNPELLSLEGLGKINVTAWLYRDDQGAEKQY